MNDSRLDVRPLGKGKNRPENVLEFIRLLTMIVVT